MSKKDQLAAAIAETTEKTVQTRPAHLQNPHLSSAQAGDVISQLIPLADLKTDPTQPRKHFEEDELKGLATSMNEDGQIAPIGVSVQDNGAYLIEWGERRFRAAQLLGWERIRAEVIALSKAAKNRLRKRLVENVQRRGLTPIEEARGYDQLKKEDKLSNRKVAEKCGKPATHVDRMLSILSLPEVSLAAVEQWETKHQRPFAATALSEAALIKKSDDQVKAIQGALVAEHPFNYVRNFRKSLQTARRKPSSVRLFSRTLRIDTHPDSKLVLEIKKPKKEVSLDEQIGFVEAVLAQLRGEKK